MLESFLGSFMGGMASAFGSKGAERTSQNTMNMIFFLVIVALLLYFVFGVGRRRR